MSSFTTKNTKGNKGTQRNSCWPVVLFMTAVVKILFSALREIFDEAAYERFLRREQLTPSRRAYREFLQEVRHLRERRPRCC